MTRLEDRQILVRDIEQARADGARLVLACALAGIDARTLRRWKAGDGLRQGDRRPDADRPIPSHALSETERARIIAVANEPRCAEMPPARIVPALADEGIYLASESSFHRVLRAHGQMNRRGRAQPPRALRPPTTHITTRPGEVWCWDVTFLPARVQGGWFYLYLILDLYSRKVVGFEVHDTDSAEHTAHLARRTALAEGLHTMSARPVLHGDNGATLKATTVLAMLHWLGIKPFVYDLDSVEFVKGDGGIRQVLSDALGEGRAHSMQTWLIAADRPRTPRSAHHTEPVLQPLRERLRALSCRTSRTGMQMPGVR